MGGAVKIPASWISCLSRNSWVSLPISTSICWGGFLEESEVVCQMSFFTAEKYGLWKQGVDEGGSEKRREKERERLIERLREKQGKWKEGENSTLSFHFWGKKLTMLVLVWRNVVYVPMRRSFIFILINISGFAHIQKIILQDQNCTCSSQWPIFCPSPLKLLCSKAKSKQCSKKKKKKAASSWQFPFYSTCCQGHLEVKPNSPFGLFCFFLPFPPPSTYVRTDMVYSFYLNSIITLDFYQTSVSGSRKGDWMWVWVGQGPVALSGR